MSEVETNQNQLSQLFESIRDSLDRLQKVEPKTASRWMDKIQWLKEDLEKDARQAEKWSEMKAWQEKRKGYSKGVESVRESK